MFCKTIASRTRKILFVLPILFAGLVACEEEETITIPLTYVLNNSHMDLHIGLNIGNSTVNLLIDTGSVGARVLKSLISDLSQINQTDIKMHYGYADGVGIAGVLAFGSFGFLPGYFINNLPFMLIENVTCGPTHVDCSANFAKDGRGGIFGTSLADISNTTIGNHLPNMLELLPKLSNGFYIHGDPANPYIVLGLTEENTKGFTYLDLEKAPRNGAPYEQWGGLLNGSYSVENNGTTTVVDNQQLFLDSGTNDMYLKDLPFKINKANNVTINFQDSKNRTFTWKFNVGAIDELASTANHGVVTNGQPGGAINLGSLAYMTYDILYDRIRGRIGFRAVNNGTSVNLAKSRSNLKLSLSGG